MAIVAWNPADNAPGYLTIDTGFAGDRLGTDVAAIDLNGDGSMELVAGSNPSANTETGFIRLYDSGGSSMGQIDGPSVGSQFGNSVTFLDDVDGDGVEDLAVGAPGISTVYVYSGASLDGVQTPMLVATITGAIGELLGSNVESAGDVDGDGFGDLAVSAPLRNMIGSVIIYSGATGSPISEIVNPTPGGGPFPVAFGDKMSGGHDVNFNGSADIAIAVGAGPNLLRVYDGLTGAVLTTIARDGSVADSNGIDSIALTDFDGDGAVDVIMGQGVAFGPPVPDPNGGPDGPPVLAGRIRAFACAPIASVAWGGQTVRNSSGKPARIRALGSTSISQNTIAVGVETWIPQRRAFLFLDDTVTAGITVPTVNGTYYHLGAPVFGAVLTSSTGRARFNLDLSGPIQITNGNNTNFLTPMVGLTLFGTCYYQDTDYSNFLSPNFAVTFTN